MVTPFYRLILIANLVFEAALTPYSKYRLAIFLIFWLSYGLWGHLHLYIYDIPKLLLLFIIITVYWFVHFLVS
jgi:hypothetical protein